jgi:hypothetical protein
MAIQYQRAYLMASTQLFAMSGKNEGPRRLREFLPYVPLLFFIAWESGIIHNYFKLMTPLSVVSLVSGLSLLFYFTWAKFEREKPIGIFLVFIVMLLNNPVPYLLLLLMITFYFQRNEQLLKTSLILSPLALVEGLGMALDLRIVMLITLGFFVFAVSHELNGIQAKTKPLMWFILSSSFILLLLSISPSDPLAQHKNGHIAYDGFHHKLESAFFENDTLTHSTLRYLDAIGYHASVLNQAITPKSLEGTSILILETPEQKYSRQEIEAIVDFVKKGGGLFILGDHTNIYDCYLNLNPILQNFGLHLNFDYSMLWEPHFTSLADFDSTEETAGATLTVNRSDNLLFYALKYTTWADLGDWHAKSNNVYMGDIVPDKKEEFGFLPICAGAFYGQGRVIAIANSDSMSGPELPYNYVFIAKVMSYLDRKNSFLRDNWLKIILIIIILLGINRARQAAIKPFITSAIIVLLLVQMEAAMPVNQDPANKIALDLGHANIEGYGSPHQYKSIFLTIFAQHYGFNPIFIKSIPEDISNYRAYITMGPTNIFSQREREMIRNYVQNGGTLVVFDGYHADTSANRTNYAANSMLQDFGLYLNETLLGNMSFFNNTTWGYQLPYKLEPTIQVRPSACSLMSNISGDMRMYSAVEVVGGTAIAYYNDTPVMAFKNIGRGKIIIVGDHTIFRHFVQYEPRFSYPDPNLKQFVENLFASLGGRKQNGI